jgi:DNA-binding IclR family transcriptional regulator
VGQEQLPVNVLGKTAAVVDVLAEWPESTAAELAELTGQPRSTVYRLLDSLQRLGWVEHGSARGRFRLGMRLFRIGSTVAGRFDERRAAMPVMEQLHEITGDSIFLAVRRDFEAVCIERLDGNRVQSLALRVGGALPLHAGGVSRALLAFEPEELWNEYVRACELAPFTKKTITRADTLLADLRRVRRQGYAISDQDVTVGIAAVAAPVFDQRGRVCASLSISGVREAVLGDARERLLELVQDGAGRISSALGHVTEPV